MKDEHIHKKVEDALQSIDGIDKAAPRPFLFTRLEARMQNEKTMWSKISSFVSRPVVAFACIFFILIMNAMVIFLSNNTSGSLTQQQGNEIAATDEYSQVSSSIYEFVNNKP